MDIKKNLFQLLLLLYSGLIMVISAFMLISFPIGAYTVFNTEIGDAITYQHPIELTSNITIELGEGFIVLWCI
ncbi:MAG: CPBP family intramembrane metalloprotease domain-containing protein, partial [Candidatus Nitrosothermus koennekii]